MFKIEEKLAIIGGHVSEELDLCTNVHVLYYSKDLCTVILSNFTLISQIRYKHNYTINLYI